MSPACPCANRERSAEALQARLQGAEDSLAVREREAAERQAAISQMLDAARDWQRQKSEEEHSLQTGAVEVQRKVEEDVTRAKAMMEEAAADKAVVQAAKEGLMQACPELPEANF
ncbi:hypothetical protein CYMTET_27049 [Cymbomonas tetramitiformis]|uniref:Uncharacterized protein n=1 Tax=Cymbomonas tetramitiformis TaxID=36881 RepID=A0AAE0FR85_9CHLO|nr:hypothetical protein CYMTET_27049 [Cymbomonas tetramitiformis]